MKRRAVISARGDRLYVSSWSITDQGASVQGDWIADADIQVSDAELGSLARAALAACRQGVPHPSFRDGPTPELRTILQVAGVKTYAAFARGTREVAVRSLDESADLTVTPYRNGGPRTGFTEMLDEVAVLDAAVDDSSLGAVLRQALAVATAGPRTPEEARL
jgi:hypothetical protein